jgi:type IV secretory pathway protease TraF
MSRMRWALCAAAVAAVIASSALAEEAGTWFMATPVPVLARGVRAVACLGSVEYLAMIAVWHGRCPGGVQPIIGVIVAVPGDRVDVIAGADIEVNGGHVQGTLPLDRDDKGLPPGRYDLQAGQYWIRGADRGGVDSRNVGLIDEQEIMSTEVPGYALVKPRKRYQPIEQ